MAGEIASSNETGRTIFQAFRSNNHRGINTIHKPMMAGTNRNVYSFVSVRLRSPFR